MKLVSYISSFFVGMAVMAICIHVNKRIYNLEVKVIVLEMKVKNLEGK